MWRDVRRTRKRGVPADTGRSGGIARESRRYGACARIATAPEERNEERKLRTRNMTKISTQLFIDGAWSDGSGAPFASRNPGNGEVVWEGASAAAHDVERAVLSARGA